jgi:hypothetical protein
MAATPAPSSQPIALIPDTYSWFVDFQDAVLASAENIEPSKLQEKVMRTEGAMFDRLQSLANEPDHIRESHPDCAVEASPNQERTARISTVVGRRRHWMLRS